VAALAVVEDLDVLEDGVCQLDPGPPAFPVEDLDLESRPEGFDDGVVETVADLSHRWQQPGLAGSPGERPGRELPWSEWMISPESGAGWRFEMAIPRALVTSVEVCVELVDQPTTRRLNVSSTTQQ